MNPAGTVKLVECPRDAMQGWKTFIPTEKKARYINALLKVGFDTIDFGSFVSPRAIPQMADTKELVGQLQLAGSRSKLLAIVANERGANDAVVFDEISYLGFPFSVSQTFQLRNTNSTIEGSLERVEEIQNLCIKNNKQLVVYISMGFGNPYGDPYNEEIVFTWVNRMVDMDIKIISLADTVGLATADQVSSVTRLLVDSLPGTEIGVHLHSTPANWKEKLDAALAAGCRRFDGALKGIGGCPMADDELVGNMDTELMIPYFDKLHLLYGLDQEALAGCSRMAARNFSPLILFKPGMEFHLEFSPKAFDQLISHQQKLLLIGSCFTEQIGNKLAQHKFSVLDNPNGILFNPVSITRAVHSYIQQRHYTATDLFYQNECWNSWEHHSRFSHPDQKTCLQMINQSQEKAHDFLKEAGWLLITLGSAFVYELENEQVVANCHKVPTDKFKKRLLTTEEVHDILKSVREALTQFNPRLNIIFTISPVRHLRDGFVENNRSKAVLINAVHQIVSNSNNDFYFPAYELVIDDLRDYRFYAEDMVHPNYAATNYVWEKFVTTCIDEQAQQLMKEIAVINAARNHKAFNPGSTQHIKFLTTNLEKTKQLSSRFPYINLEDELQFFAG